MTLKSCRVSAQSLLIVIALHCQKFTLKFCPAVVGCRGRISAVVECKLSSLDVVGWGARVTLSGRIVKSVVLEVACRSGSGLVTRFSNWNRGIDI